MEEQRTFIMIKGGRLNKNQEKAASKKRRDLLSCDKIQKGTYFIIVSNTIVKKQRANRNERQLKELLQRDLVPICPSWTPLWVVEVSPDEMEILNEKCNVVQVKKEDPSTVFNRVYPQYPSKRATEGQPEFNI